MKKNLLLLAVVLVCVFPLRAQKADPMTGNTLFQKCQWSGQAEGTVEQVREFDRCNFYIAGVVDAFLMMQNGVDESGRPMLRNKYICLPDDVNSMQTFRIVKKYLDDHPEKLHMRANRLVWDAMAGAFPCR